MYIVETGYTSLYRLTGKYTAIYSVENNVLYYSVEFVLYCIVICNTLFDIVARFTMRCYTLVF